MALVARSWPWIAAGVVLFVLFAANQARGIGYLS